MGPDPLSYPIQVSLPDKRSRLIGLLKYLFEWEAQIQLYADAPFSHDSILPSAFVDLQAGWFLTSQILFPRRMSLRTIPLKASRVFLALNTVNSCRQSHSDTLVKRQNSDEYI